MTRIEEIKALMSSDDWRQQLKFKINSYELVPELLGLVISQNEALLNANATLKHKGVSSLIKVDAALAKFKEWNGVV